MHLSTIFALLTSYFAGNPVFFLLQQGAKHAEQGFEVDTSLTKVIAGIGYRLELEWPAGGGSKSHPYSTNVSMASKNVEEDGRDSRDALHERRLRKDRDGDWHDDACPEHECKPGELSLWYICEMPSSTCADVEVGNGECATLGETAYAFMRDCKKWDQAAKLCRGDEPGQPRGYLVSVNTQAEHEFLTRKARGDAYHIGLSKQMRGDGNDGAWRWEDGTVLDWENGRVPWGVGQPDGAWDEYPNYVFMNFWDDREHHCRDKSWDKLYLYLALISIGLTAIIVFVNLTISAMYKTKCTDKRQRFPDAAVNAQSPFGQGGGMDFQISVCSCCEDQPTCCHGIFCFPARVGDNYQTAEVAGFWCVVCLLVGSDFIFVALDMVCSILTEGGIDPNLRTWARGLLVAAFLHKYRQQLRLRLGNPNTQTYCCMDFLCYWWCGPCLAIQEGRTVDAIQGKQQQCCCSLQDGLAPGTQRYPQMQQGHSQVQPLYVGGPVAVGQVIGAPVQAQPVIAQAQPVNYPTMPGTVVQATCISPGKTV